MILSASDTDKCVGRIARTLLCYVIAAILCAIFGAVYELFSHEVYSFSMIYAFLFPLAGGVLPFSIVMLRKPKKYLRLSALRLYHFGIAALTVGSIVKGILDIYGTTNRLLTVYWIAGVMLGTAGLVLSAANMRGERAN